MRHARLLAPLLIFWLLSATLAAAPPRARSEPAGLTVEGETVTVVTKLPFRVRGPAGASDYTWGVPAAWKYAEADCAIEVTAAPEGSYAVTLRTLTVDFEAKRVIRKSYRLQVNVGKVADPLPPPDALTAALQAAYDADGEAGKSTHLARLLALYRQAPALADDESIATAGKLMATLQDARARLMPETALKGVRSRIAQELLKSLPSTSDAALDAATRANAKAAFNRVAKALEGVRP